MSKDHNDFQKFIDVLQHPRAQMKFIKKTLLERFKTQPKLAEYKISVFEGQYKDLDPSFISQQASKVSLLDDYEKERWDRQIKHQVVDQNKLKNAKIAIFGIGGIGSNIALGLVYAGVYNFKIIDFDTIEPSNLNRQTLYIPRDIGRRKSDVAKERLLEISPNAVIGTLNIMIDFPIEMNLMQLAESDYNEDIKKIDDIIKWADFVVNGIDYNGGPYLINDLCYKNKKPYYWAIADPFMGDIFSYIPQISMPCLRCIFSSESMFNNLKMFRYKTSNNNLPKAMNIGNIVITTGTLVAEMIINDIIGVHNNCHGKYIVYDGMNFAIEKIEIEPDKNCECSHL